MQEKLKTYKEFWPHYLQEHSTRACRNLHFLGTTAALACIVLLLVTREPTFFIAGLLFGYGPAWIAHFFIEKNRPATFTYPIWSLISDFRMYFLWINGNLNKELKLCGVYQ